MEETDSERHQSGKEQKVEDDIKAQLQVVAIPGETWKMALDEGQKRKLLSVKEVGCLEVAVKIPHKIPSPKQCVVILEALDKLKGEGLQF